MEIYNFWIEVACSILLSNIHLLPQLNEELNLDSTTFDSWQAYIQT